MARDIANLTNITDLKPPGIAMFRGSTSTKELNALLEAFVMDGQLNYAAPVTSSGYIDINRISSHIDHLSDRLCQ